MVFHLVVNEVPTAPIISSRHPIMAGLRNCLRAANRYSIALLTLPLLLVEKLGPVSVWGWGRGGVGGGRLCIQYMCGEDKMAIQCEGWRKGGRK